MNPEDITKLLSAYNVILVKVNDLERVHELLAGLLKRIIWYRNLTAIILLGSRPAEDVMRKLDEHGFQVSKAIREGRLLLIDSLTKSIGGLPVRGTLYVSSPSDLNELQLNVEKGLRRSRAKRRKACLLIEGLSTFLIFNTANKVLQFLIFLIGRLRALDYYCLIFHYGSELEARIENVVKQYVDRVYEDDRTRISNAPLHH